MEGDPVPPIVTCLGCPVMCGLYGVGCCHATRQPFWSKCQDTLTLLPCVILPVFCSISAHWLFHHVLESQATVIPCDQKRKSVLPYSPQQGLPWWWKGRLFVMHTHMLCFWDVVATPCLMLFHSVTKKTFTFLLISHEIDLRPLIMFVDNVLQSTKLKTL